MIFLLSWLVLGEQPELGMMPAAGCPPGYTSSYEERTDGWDATTIPIFCVREGTSQEFVYVHAIVTVITADFSTILRQSCQLMHEDRLAQIGVMRGLPPRTEEVVDVRSLITSTIALASNSGYNVAGALETSRTLRMKLEYTTRMFEAFADLTPETLANLLPTELLGSAGFSDKILAIMKGRLQAGKWATPQELAAFEGESNPARKDSQFELYSILEASMRHMVNAIKSTDRAEDLNKYTSAFFGEGGAWDQYLKMSDSHRSTTCCASSPNGAIPSLVCQNGGTAVGLTDCCSCSCTARYSGVACGTENICAPSAAGWVYAPPAT